MQLPTTLDAVKNRKTQKYFILVDDSLDTRYKVINPSGEILILPDLLFEDDPLTVSQDQYQLHFTGDQLESFSKYQLKQAAFDAAPVRPEPQLPKRFVADAKPEPRKKSPPKKSAPSRRGVGASWSAPRLTFYRHKIEPLDLKQSFRVEVQGVGVFEITKEDFLNHFNDASMSPSYRADGLYVYKDLPDKAKKYLKGG
jgi:hypothetical protein